MRKLFYLLCTIIFSSCSTYSPVVNFVDYSSYQDQGVFLTEANSPNFDYTPVGSINVLIYSGYVRKAEEKESKSKTDDIYYSSQSSRSYHNATIEAAIDHLIAEAKTKGANCIVNLKYEYVPALKNNPDGWYVSGMAVKK